MKKRALVLGGGGPVGIGWESGLAAGLEERGVRLADADLIVGTSAGSVVGAQLALGRPTEELFEAQIAIAEGDRADMRPIQRSFDMGPLLLTFAKMYTSDAPRQELRRELGALSLSAQTMSEEESLGTFGRRSAAGLEAWPERAFICTAIDTADGSFVAWDKESGVPLALAVASSCAVPGIFPPITINGRRYMDGGMGSSTNAELARGYDSVLVVSVTAGMARPGREEIAARLRARLESELQELRDGGSAVESIQPDEESREAFGPNLLDGTRRRLAAEAGLRQGRLEAERLRGWWG
jgi:NTE family protein